MKQYSISITIEDTTSVDASSTEEAKQLALEIFKESGYDISRPYELYINRVDKLYVIEADDPLPSWDGKFTESELLEKFWDYALRDELYDKDYWYEQYVQKTHSGLTKQKWLKFIWTRHLPEWFTLDEIQEAWGITIREAIDSDG